MNPENRTILPGLAFKGFSSRYQQPVLSEGFQDITEVKFKVRFSRNNNNACLRTDLACYSLLGMRRNEISGLDAGLDDNRPIGDGCDIYHEVAWLSHGLDGNYPSL
jgi:hypothetical protein